MLKATVLAALCATSAYAHFTLDFPATRGFDEDKEPQFCGGFNTAGERQPFPLNSAPIRINSGHTLANVAAFLSTNSNPTSFADFNATSNGTSIPLVTNYFQVPQGQNCWNVDLGALNVGLANGSLVTLQIKYDGGDNPLYQCTDLVLLSNYTVPSNETCSKDAAASSTTAGGASASHSSHSSSASSAVASSSSKPSSSTRRVSLPWTGLGVVALVMMAA